MQEKNEILIFQKDAMSLGVSLDGCDTGTLCVYVIRPGNNQSFSPWPCEINSVICDEHEAKVVVRCDDEDVMAAIKLERSSLGFKGSFSASGSGSAIVRLVWKLPAHQQGFPFVPAFMYGFNEGGQSPSAMYPQLSNSRNQGPAKPWVADEWLMRTDRSSHSLTSIIADVMTFAIGGRDVCRFENNVVAEKTGIGISSTDPHCLSFSLGFTNQPFTYSAHAGKNFISRPEGFVDLENGEVTSEFFLFLFRENNRHQAAAKLLRSSYDILHDRIDSLEDLPKAIKAVADALLEYGYNEEAKNFYITLYEDNKEVSDRNNFPIAWTGGVQAAYPLLAAGHLLKQEKWVHCARDVFDNIAENGISEKSGLFFENYNLASDKWNTHGWWYGALEKPGHSGYVNGQACHYVLLGYLVEKQEGIERTSWFNAAKRVLDCVLQTQGQDGRFGYTYNENNAEILDDDGFSSCWFTPALVSLYLITAEKKYFTAAIKAMDFYRGYIEEFHVYGGPHDIFKSPDEEGVLAWCNAAMLLHCVTEDDRFLSDLLMGLDYEFSWKFAYNVVSEVEPLKSLNWCSTGGSVTSVNNSHIHPMGSAIVSCISYAAAQSRDSYLRARLDDTLRWTGTIYLHHDGHYGWGKKGMVNERFCYTDSLLLERFPDGSPASTWFCGHSWASGSVLEGLVAAMSGAPCLPSDLISRSLSDYKLSAKENFK